MLGLHARGTRPWSHNMLWANFCLFLFEICASHSGWVKSRSVFSILQLHTNHVHCVPCHLREPQEAQRQRNP